MKKHLIALSLLTAVIWMPQLSANPANVKPELTMGPDACNECHKDVISVWHETHHFSTFKEMPRSDDADKIGKAMGIDRVKTDENCVSCHFTAWGSGAKPQAGVACESCHGAAKNWIKVHNDFGGPKAKKENEPAAHKAERMAKAEANGMIKPGNIYGLFNQCYTCHSVENEKVVNVGGHKAGSDFEAVSWFNGEVRHYVYGKKGNPAMSPSEQRVVYIVGQALNLEHAYRGAAKATAEGKFLQSMTDRAKSAKAGLEAINGKQSIPEIGQILSIANGTPIKANAGSAMTGAADKIADLNKKMATSLNGDTLSAIDSLIPPASKYKGKPKA
jgi:hypothetical protein